jgi:hypothetical protein
MNKKFVSHELALKPEKAVEQTIKDSKENFFRKVFVNPIRYLFDDQIYILNFLFICKKYNILTNCFKLLFN